MLYSEATVVCLPSTTRAEGFGMVLMEAMSQGLPVVATPVGCATSLVRDNDTGVAGVAPDARIRLLERRRTFLEQRLDTITGSLTMNHDTYTLSLMQHGRETTEQDIAWLNGLIAAERRATEITATGAPKRREQRALRRKERTT